MNNTDITAVREFRRFANTYIYQDTFHLIIEKIKEYCQVDRISYDPLPQATIKFHSKIAPDASQTNYTTIIHSILKDVFIEYFNNPIVVGLARNKIHTEINNDELKKILRRALSEIQSGNPSYLGLLFNIVILNESYIYL